MKTIDEIKNIVVIGAGTMGHSIAQVYAHKGFEVTVVDLNQDALDRAITNIKANLETLVESGMIENNEVEKIINTIQFSTDLRENAAKADLVVEAVSEDPAIKEKVFETLSEICREDTIFASNTSGLNVFKIAKKIANPQRLIIHHWFAPPHIIPLVEIVPGRKTSKELIELSVKFMEKIGKKPILMRKFEDLFIVNKIQIAIGSAVFELMLKKLADPETIDLAVKYSLGIRLPIVGVAQTFDFTGLDILNGVLKSKNIELSLIQEKLANGDLGVKTGKGLYDYHGKSETEVLKARDKKYIKMLKFLEEIEAFKPIE